MLDVEKLPQKKKIKIAIFALVALIILTLAVAGGVFFGQKIASKKLTKDVLAKATVTKVTDEVGKLIQTPKNEEPTVAMIQDKNKLKEQNFFNNAKNGDYLLVYSKAKLAILYRESENKLINVGPVTINSDQANNNQTTPSQPQAQTPKKP